jgi:hypothetical protein
LPLIACAFNYEAHTTEFSKLGRIPVLKARMNADLHMAEDLKNTGKGNLFVIFGEPDITLLPEPDGKPRVPLPVVVTGNPFDHPDAQRRFRAMANVEELERALDFPWEKWTVFLHPEQRQLVERDYA